MARRRSAENPNTIIATANGIEGSDAGVIPTLTTNCPAGTTTCSTTLLTSGVTPLNVAKQTSPCYVDVRAAVDVAADCVAALDMRRKVVLYPAEPARLDVHAEMAAITDKLLREVVAVGHVDTGAQHRREIEVAPSLRQVPGRGANYGAPAGAGVPGTYGGFNGPTSAASAALIRATTAQIIGAEVGYQHWWLDNLRSNINAGWESQSGIPIKLVNANGTPGGAAVTGGQAAAINKEIFTAHANLIWNPVSFADVGLEYMWGQRTVLNNQHATMNVLISEFKFRF